MKRGLRLRFSLHKNKQQGYMWILRGHKNEPCARSFLTFPSEKECRDDIREFQYLHFPDVIEAGVEPVEE